MGLAASRHVGSSRTGARTRVPCIGRQILNYCATREAPPVSSYTLYLLNDMLTMSLFWPALLSAEEAVAMSMGFLV